MLRSILNVQINMIIKILILKNNFIVRKKYVHVRVRRRTINHIGLTGMDDLINLFNKQSDQRLHPLTTPNSHSPNSARNSNELAYHNLDLFLD